jgi:hypothetical protein
VAGSREAAVWQVGGKELCGRWEGNSCVAGRREGGGWAGCNFPIVRNSGNHLVCI